MEFHIPESQIKNLSNQLSKKIPIPQHHTLHEKPKHSADEILDVGDHPYETYWYEHSGAGHKIQIEDNKRICVAHPTDFSSNAKHINS